MDNRVKLQLLTRDAGESAFEIFEVDSGEAHASFKPKRLPDAEWEIRRQPLAVDGTRHFVLNNRRQDRYLLLTAKEHFLWERLDGRNSLDEIARAFHLEYGAFDYALIRELLAKLYHAGLLELASRNELTSPQERRDGALLSHVVERWRHFAVRLPGADRYCAAIYRCGGFVLFYRVAFWIVVALACAAVGATVQLAGQSVHFARLLAAYPYSTTAIILLALLGAAILHVLVHALACKAHGRRVREMGFFLLQGILPTFYADVTDIFMSNRRARLAVDLAGPMVEVFFGSLAMLGAFFSDPGIGQALLFGIGVLLWESALINLYPFSFLELDGYNMLADLLAMPMLRKQALALLPELGKRLRRPKTIERAEAIQIGYLVLCLVSVLVYLLLHLDALSALLTFDWH